MSEQPIRILHFSSRYEECGVAKYLGHYVNSMADAPEVQNEYFDVSPYQTPHMSPQELQDMAIRLQKELKNYDILHVQHEFAIYAHDSFRRIVESGKKAGKKVVITLHISPSAHGASKIPRLHGLGPHSLVKYLRDQRHHQGFVRDNIEPLRMADLLLVHNDSTIASLRQFGVPDERIKKVVHPVQVFDEPPASHLLAEKLNRQKGDVVYCTIGFLHRYKGLFDAVKALKFLPDNYKLAILGGMKADSDDIELYNRLCDLIDILGLHRRVYITGYVPNDDTLNALIRECDVCVYLYDRVYYANVSSGSLNLAFANGRPLIAYPTATVKDVAALADGAVVLTESFAYYELARQLKQIDLKKQAALSEAYAEKMAWPKVSKELVEIYQSLAD